MITFFLQDGPGDYAFVDRELELDREVEEVVMSGKQQWAALKERGAKDIVSTVREQRAAEAHASVPPSAVAADSAAAANSTDATAAAAAATAATASGGAANARAKVMNPVSQALKSSRRQRRKESFMTEFQSIFKKGGNAAAQWGEIAAARAATKKEVPGFKAEPEATAKSASRSKCPFGHGSSAGGGGGEDAEDGESEEPDESSRSF